MALRVSNSGATGSPAASSPPRLSVAIVCKDNAATIGRTLESVKGLADEIVAIDSGSTDATIDILGAHGARIIRSPWLGHVKTKQLALESCTGAWVLCIDSDESLNPALALALREFLDWSRQSDFPADINGAIINRKTYYRDQPLRHVWQPEPRLRLVRRGCARWGGLDPHDKLELTRGRAEKLNAGPDGDLRHDSFPTFAEHLRKQWHHASTMARSLHADGQRSSLLRLVISPPGAFIKQLVLKRGFLDGVPGWLAAASTACAALIKHAVLLELQIGRLKQ